MIHAVGPVWNGGAAARTSCWRPAIAARIELCQAHGLASIAFPAISTGVYRFPADRAANIAVTTTVDALAVGAGRDPRHLLLLFARQRPLHEQALAAFGRPCAD